MMYQYGYGHPEWGFGFGSVFSILIWIVVFAFIFALIRRSSHRHWHPWCGYDNRALEILKERYAKGEINKQEFEEKKKDLM